MHMQAQKCNEMHVPEESWLGVGLANLAGQRPAVDDAEIHVAIQHVFATWPQVCSANGSDGAQTSLKTMAF